MLRPLNPADFNEWRAVRAANQAWLNPWEPRRSRSLPDPVQHRHAFEARCSARERERNNDHAYPFGLFINHELAGEININNVIRGALQSATLGYWIAQRHAGNNYVVEGVTVAMRYAFEQLMLHRLEICIVPRNSNSRRVMEKLEIRSEGTAQRYLEINGIWEDHLRYGITAEEWLQRGAELNACWIDRTDQP